ncbi:Na-translocating system protein MpsC family protein, partial [Mycobacterium tuberculosis]
MSSLVPEMKAYLQLLTGMDQLEFYYDWELHNQSGIFVGYESEYAPTGSMPHDHYIGKEELHHEIGCMSQRIQKWPDSITSYMLNKRTLLIIRTGTLIELSKQLIRLKDEELLKQAVKELEKKTLLDNKQVELVLNTKVVDVFLDWDLAHDRS